MKLSNRLLKICDLIDNVNSLADVGCDHGLVVIELAKRGLVKELWAIDNKMSPLNKAIQNINKNEYNNKIRPLLSDGLLALNINPEAIIIAGMGSDLIIQIMINSFEKFTGAKYIILQPQTKVSHLRYWLYSIGFEIIEDILISDNDIYYPILKIVFSNKYCYLNRLQMLFGFNYQHLNNYDWIMYNLNKINFYHNHYDLFAYAKNIIERRNNDVIKK